MTSRASQEYENSALNNRLQHEALGNKPHKLCSYSPELRAEVDCLRLTLIDRNWSNSNVTRSYYVLRVCSGGLEHHSQSIPGWIFDRAHFHLMAKRETSPWGEMIWRMNVEGTENNKDDCNRKAYCRHSTRTLSSISAALFVLRGLLSRTADQNKADLNRLVHPLQPCRLTSTLLTSTLLPTSIQSFFTSLPLNYSLDDPQGIYMQGENLGWASRLSSNKEAFSSSPGHFICDKRSWPGHSAKCCKQTCKQWRKCYGCDILFLSVGNILQWKWNFCQGDLY